MLRDNLVGLIEPMPTARENDGSSLALSIHKQRQASDDRSSCLKNPRPAGAESSLTERTTSPFQTEPRHNYNLYFLGVNSGEAQFPGGSSGLNSIWYASEVLDLTKA